jgi:hypothetical protein
MMRAWVRALFVVAMAVATGACTGAPPCGYTGPWAKVDLAAMHADCTADASLCPAPYQCITYNLATGYGPPAGEGTRCELPCADNHDCPQGYFCQGLCATREGGLPAGFCIEDI